MAPSSSVSRQRTQRRPRRALLQTPAAIKRRARYQSNKAWMDRLEKESRVYTRHQKACAIARARRAPCPVTSTVFARTDRSRQVGTDVTDLIASYLRPRPVTAVQTTFLIVKQNHTGVAAYFTDFTIQWLHYNPTSAFQHPSTIAPWRPWRALVTSKKPMFVAEGHLYGKDWERGLCLNRTPLIFYPTY